MEICEEYLFFQLSPWNILTKFIGFSNFLKSTSLQLHTFKTFQVIKKHWDLFPRARSKPERKTPLNEIIKWHESGRLQIQILAKKSQNLHHPR